MYNAWNLFLELHVYSIKYRLHPIFFSDIVLYTLKAMQRKHWQSGISVTACWTPLKAGLKDTGIMKCQTWAGCHQPSSQLFACASSQAAPNQTVPCSLSILHWYAIFKNFFHTRCHSTKKQNTKPTNQTRKHTKTNVTSQELTVKTILPNFAVKSQFKQQ